MQHRDEPERHFQEEKWDELKENRNNIKKMLMVLFMITTVFLRVPLNKAFATICCTFNFIKYMHS